MTDVSIRNNRLRTVPTDAGGGLVTRRMMQTTEALAPVPRQESHVLGAARTLYSLARVVTGECPDPCSDAKFWWRAGYFHRVDIEGPDHQVVLPTELGPVAGALPARPAQQ